MAGTNDVAEFHGQVWMSRRQADELQAAMVERDQLRYAMGAAVPTINAVGDSTLKTALA